jgi:hypothetical protein
MKRRSFIRAVAAGSAAIPALTFPHELRAQAPLAKPTPLPTPPFAPKSPAIAFDAPAGSWTMVVLPDTQNYSKSFPQVFDRQCEWIAAHQKKHNILFVAHEGDITNDNTPQEWENARRSMSLLNEAGVAYSLVPGNHDTGPDVHHRCHDRTTPLNTYFTEKDFAASAASGLFEPGKLQNNWHHFDTPTGKFLLIGTEYGPRDVVIDWVRDIVQRNADRKAILLTHCYLYSNSTRYDFAQYGRDQAWQPKTSVPLTADGCVNDGEDIWKKVIAPSKNVMLTLNGHVLHNGTGHLVSAAADGHSVHQILANYQAAVAIDDGAGGVAHSQRVRGTLYPSRAFGGGGFLRLMQFHPDGETVSVRSYSPWYDRWLTQPDQQFTFKLGKGAVPA